MDPVFLPADGKGRASGERVGSHIPNLADERTSHPAGQNEPRGYDAAMAATETLEALLRQAFPDASRLAVEDRTGGGDHFQVTVASAGFDGLSLVEQHRLVYDALAAPLADGSIHELRIKTTPETTMTKGTP